jgi:single-stranded DNA-binding protein
MIIKRQDKEDRKMLNQAIIVGKITNIDYDKGITISVTRNYKNEHGVYEVDVVIAKDYRSVMKSAKKYLKVGNVVAVKGTLQTDPTEKLEFVIEKFSFID